jgi:Ni/Co efflux regulator RcnB
MHKLLISILLASAAASPALADPPDKSDRHAAHVERQQAKEQGRAERAPVQVQRPQFNGGQGHSQQFVGRQYVQPNPGAGPRQVEALRGDRGGNTEAFRGNRGGNNDARDGVRNWRGEQAQRNGGAYQNERARQYNRQQTMRYQGRRDSRVQWSRNWRNDRRYNWHEYRNNHRSRFHLGVYVDPFGYGYQSFGIGYQLTPNYYSANYWINDPWDYGLPPPAPGTVWVRYYNDALLVDMESGEVVDAINGFFW